MPAPGSQRNPPESELPLGPGAGSGGGCVFPGTNGAAPGPSPDWGLHCGVWETQRRRLGPSRAEPKPEVRSREQMTEGLVASGFYHSGFMFSKNICLR